MNKTDTYFRIRYSLDMILSIEDFINCISLHKTELKSPRNVGLMNFMRDFYGNKNFNPAGVLKDYIYLEACSFFHYAKKLKNEGKNIPDLPNYFKELKDFRDKVVAHKDYKECYKSYEDWTEAHEGIQKLIPIPKLIKDVQAFYDKVIKEQSFIQT
jgi:hypothetical protein